jgi:kynurenine formamidase
MTQKIIDLSLPIFSGMPVYPGDPEVSVELIQTIDADDWNLRQISISSHIGTHVNVPAHCIKDGPTLDDYSLESFMGPARLYRADMSVPADTGIIFHRQNIDREIAAWIIKNELPFVGLSDAFEIDEAIEKQLLAAGVILYEKLSNTDQLPDMFTFYGVPLKIVAGDGCPVRAFAVIEST